MFQDSVSYNPDATESFTDGGEEVLEETTEEISQEENAEPSTDDAIPKEETEGGLEGDEEESIEETTEPIGETKQSDGVRKRMDKLTKRWRDTERENLKLKTGFEAERDALRQKITALEGISNVSKKPVVDDFETTEEYVEALVEFKTKGSMDKIKSDAQDATIRANADAQHNTLEAKLSVGLKAHSDFDEVVRSKDLPINGTMVGICSELDEAAEVLYYLGKNPEECSAIAGMAPVHMAIKLAGINHAVKQPLKKKVSKTPAPIKPLVSRGRGKTKQLGEMTTAEYRKRRGFNL